jgi:hypothetical protein
VHREQRHLVALLQALEQPVVPALPQVRLSKLVEQT